MVAWLTKTLSIDFASVRAMRWDIFIQWHETAKEFHNDRLDELADIMKETLGTLQSGQQGQQQGRREVDPLSNFF